MAIPKIIHYCWFGEKEFPALGRRCLASWKKFLPDYRIVLWNELNFDLSAFCFTREAAAMKKWAFVSDFLRLYALYRRGLSGQRRRGAEAARWLLAAPRFYRIRASRLPGNRDHGGRSGAPVDKRTARRLLAEAFHRRKRRSRSDSEYGTDHAGPSETVRRAFEQSEAVS